METTTKTEQMHPARPQAEHEWLKRFLGEWVYEGEGLMDPDQPPVKFTGTESVRAVGDLWIIAEGRGACPGGEEEATMITTLGFDPRTGRFRGSWIGSMMAHLWIYDGDLDRDRRILTLNSEGPDMPDSANLTKSQDIIEWIDDDHRRITSRFQRPDGTWHQCMTAEYRRA